MVNTGDMFLLVSKVLDGLENTGRRKGMNTPEAKQLVFRTGLVESGYRHLRQKLWRGRIGVARSFFQFEPWVARSVINDYIKYRPSIKKDVERICMVDLSKMNDPDEEEVLELQLMGNILFGIALCRLKYRPVPKRIPIDVTGQGYYWLKYYNAGGKGNVYKFVKTAKRFPIGG